MLINKSKGKAYLKKHTSVEMYALDDWLLLLCICLFICLFIWLNDETKKSSVSSSNGGKAWQI